MGEDGHDRSSQASWPCSLEWQRHRHEWPCDAACDRQDTKQQWLSRIACGGKAWEEEGGESSNDDRRPDTDAVAYLMHV